MATAEQIAIDIVAASFGGWTTRELQTMLAGLSDDFIQWHSHIRRDFTKTEHQAMLARFIRHVTLDYHQVTYLALDGGKTVLVRCLCDIRVANGGSARDVPFGLVFHLRDGRIHRCDEYMDGASLPNMSVLIGPDRGASIRIDGGDTC